MYKFSKYNDIVREFDSAFIPIDELNNDYKEYLNWLSLGNEPIPYDNSQDLENEIYNIAIQDAKEDALTKTYDELSIAQKKILMGLIPTKADLGL